MTQLLQNAVERARQLSVAEQDAIAAIILEELDDEQRPIVVSGRRERLLARKPTG